MVVHHARAVDQFGRWFGRMVICIEAELRYPDLEAWCLALKDWDLRLHWYTSRSTARGFSGRLWILYKEKE